jgi:hypothetical protein
MNIPTFNMSFYMSNHNMYTINAIRAGIRTATTRYYDNEIRLMKTLSHGQPIRFIRTDKNTKQVVDSIIVFATSYDSYTKDVYKQWPPYHSIIDDDVFIKHWCQLEGWDESFAKSYFTSNIGEKLHQLTYDLYPPTYNYSPDNITELKDNEVFVYGANTEFRHGAGAAKHALKFGAVYGLVEAYKGQTYGLITTDLNEPQRPSIPMSLLQDEVDKFIQFAKNNTHLTFLVTEVGCGLAGFTVEQVAPLFKPVLLDKISNVRLPKKFVRELIVSSIEAILWVVNLI